MTKTIDTSQLGAIKVDPTKTHGDTRLHRALVNEASFLRSMGKTDEAGFILRAVYAIGPASAERILNDMRNDYRP